MVAVNIKLGNDRYLLYISGSKSREDTTRVAFNTANTAAARHPPAVQAASSGHWHCLGGLAFAVCVGASMRFCNNLLLRMLLASKFEPYASLRLLQHAASPCSTAKPRALRRRGVCAAAAAALVAKSRAARALGVRDGLLDRCPETASCISSQDDAARGGRSFRPPWAYDDNDWTGARDKLLVALQRSEANDADVNGRYIRCGDLEFYFTENDATVQFRGDGRDADRRLAKLRTRCGFEEIVVLRNRRRTFGVGESAFDSYGPSFFDQSDAALLAPDALKTRDLDPMAPEAFPAPDKATRKWLREKRAEAM